MQNLSVLLSHMRRSMCQSEKEHRGARIKSVMMLIVALPDRLRVTTLPGYPINFVVALHRSFLDKVSGTAFCMSSLQKKSFFLCPL